MYGNPIYNNQMYQQDLQNMRDRIDRQLQQMQNQQPTAINQTFQLSPNQSNGIKYANSIDDVKKELVFSDTLFVNKEYTKMWLKNASGDTKTYEIKEIIEMDEKDRQIADLTAKINMLEREMNDNESKYDTSNVDAASTSKKSSTVSSNKSSEK